MVFLIAIWARGSVLELGFFFPDNEEVEQAGLQLNFSFTEGDRRKLKKTELRLGGDLEMTKRARSLCMGLGLAVLARKVTVRWNPRMRSTAGRATWPDAVVEVNPALQEISERETERTFLHELAHLVAYERAGKRRIRPHGPEWRRACCELGIPGERAGHSLPLPSRKMRRKWRYFCPGCWAVFDRVRKMRGTSACYACCLKHNGGDYDERFRFVEKRIS